MRNGLLILLKLVPLTQVNGLVDLEMDMEYKYGQTMLVMRVSIKF